MHHPKPVTLPLRTARRVIVLLVVAGGLSGCIGLGIHAARSAFGDKDMNAAERIRKAQEDAIATAHGGNGSAPIAWSVSSTGMRGTLTPDATNATAGECRPFRQTLEYVGLTLQGTLTACPKGTDGWSLRAPSAESSTAR